MSYWRSTNKGGDEAQYSHRLYPMTKVTMNGARMTASGDSTVLDPPMASASPPLPRLHTTGGSVPLPPVRHRRENGERRALPVIASVLVKADFEVASTLGFTYSLPVNSMKKGEYSH